MVHNKYCLCRYLYTFITWYYRQPVAQAKPFAERTRRPPGKNIPELLHLPTFSAALTVQGHNAFALQGESNQTVPSCEGPVNIYTGQV